MTPDILTLPSFGLVGLSARFISIRSPEANNFQVIPALWGSFCQRRHEWPLPLDGFTYGACRAPSERSRPDEFEYLAGIAVPDAVLLPAGFVRWHIPARSYARFLHRGPIHNLGSTLRAIHEQWLPASGRVPAQEGIDLERYDERFLDGQSPDSELEILVPLET